MTNDGSYGQFIFLFYYRLLLSYTEAKVRGERESKERVYVYADEKDVKMTSMGYRIFFFFYFQQLFSYTKVDLW